MFAKTANELRKMIKQNPGTVPSTFIMDDSFAAWCYDNRELLWLRAAFNRDADPEDCKEWRLTAPEWRKNVEMAILALAGK